MLNNYITPDRIILNPVSQNKWRMLEILTRLYCRDMSPDLKEKIFYAILWREMKFSTGLGGKIAIPHGRTEFVTKTGIIFCRFKKSINWESIDNKKVNFVFLVVGPMDATEEYLDILSKISKLLSRKMMRNALLETNNEKKICQLIKNSEERKSKRHR